MLRKVIEMADNAGFPHAVAPPYANGWQQALTDKYGPRGENWTSAKSEPQWTVSFREAEAAAWFKQNWSP